MGQFMDVRVNLAGVTAEDLAAAHQADVHIHVRAGHQPGDVHEITIAA
jgi:hypothetical protein